MGRTKAYCKQCRREGAKLFLKGERCFTKKCSVERRNYPPGEHGQGRKRQTEFGIRLREKQKARRIYGLNERQFRGYFEKASKQYDLSRMILFNQNFRNSSRFRKCILDAFFVSDSVPLDYALHYSHQDARFRSL